MIIILNNKCNFNNKEFECYQNQLKNITSNHKLVLCPSSIYLSRFNLTNFYLGAQNVSCYDKGAYTGEISASQLKDLGVEYSIVGHSERRRYFKENNSELKTKIQQLLKQNITPVLCIGEQEKSEKKSYILNQLEIIEDLENNHKIIIAYEPVWAIGTGILPSIKEIEEIVQIIREKFPNNYIIYGGSVDENSINDLKLDLLDGYLLGGLSLNPGRLQQFLNQIN